jgi:hypothetical protein
MFNLDPAPTFDATVLIPVPGGPPAPLRLRFKHMGRKAVQAWVADAKDRDDAQFLLRVVAGSLVIGQFLAPGFFLALAGAFCIAAASGHYRRRLCAALPSWRSVAPRRLERPPRHGR